MCIKLLRYSVCNHERRQFLEKCRFVRRVGCFEPIFAYFYGPTGTSPCRYPMVAGEVHEVEGWCSEACKKKYGVLSTRKFKGRTPSVYMRERVEEIARDRKQREASKPRWSERTAMEIVGAQHGYGAKMEQEYEEAAAGPAEAKADVRAPSVPLYRHEGKVHHSTDEGVPLVWPFKGHPDREQIAPALDAGPQLARNPPQQKKDEDADMPGRDHRSNRASAKRQSERSERDSASMSRKDSKRSKSGSASVSRGSSKRSERSTASVSRKESKRSERDSTSVSRKDSKRSDRSTAFSSRKSRRPASETSFWRTESGHSKRSSVIARPLSEMYRQITDPEEPERGEGQRKGKRTEKGKGVEKTRKGEKAEKKGSRGDKLSSRS